MKKLLFLLLFIPLISYQGFSQSKKVLKKIKKIEIINRGLNFNGTFVPRANPSRSNATEVGSFHIPTIESNFTTAMFAVGLDTGDYYFKENTIFYKGDYAVQIYTKGAMGGTIEKIIIEDCNNNFKPLAIITELDFKFKEVDVIEAVFFKLMESNIK